MPEDSICVSQFYRPYVSDCSERAPNSGDLAHCMVAYSVATRGPRICVKVSLNSEQQDGMCDRIIHLLESEYAVTKRPPTGSSDIIIAHNKQQQILSYLCSIFPGTYQTAFQCVWATSDSGQDIEMMWPRLERISEDDLSVVLCLFVGSFFFRSGPWSL